MSAVDVVCQDCGETFYVAQDERWKRVCRFCYRKEMDARTRVAGLQRTVELLRAQTIELANELHQMKTRGPSLDAPRIRQLVQLCHPDKHNGSKTAMKITQWLLDVRREVA